MDVFTVGHGTRSLEELIDTLRAAAVVVLVDVRRFPASRRHPQFNRESLQSALPAAGVSYVFAGDALGGRRKAQETSRHAKIRNDSFRGYADHMDTPVFRAGVDDVEERVARGERVALMCAETHWSQCHRRFIADALAVDGFHVVHLISPARKEEHKSMPEMRVDASGRPVYDGGAPSLFSS